MNITKKTAKRLYHESPAWFKEQLEAEFGVDCISLNTYKSIKTFDDACEELEICSEDIYSKKDTLDEIAYKKLKIIVRAINTNSKGETWVPDWKDTDQKKWWPWFVLSSGFGFSGSLYVYACASTYVGARLCFETSEQCKYAATQFIDLYEQFLTIKN